MKKSNCCYPGVPYICHRYISNALINGCDQCETSYSLHIPGLIDTLYFTVFIVISKSGTPKFYLSQVAAIVKSSTMDKLLISIQQNPTDDTKLLNV